MIRAAAGGDEPAIRACAEDAYSRYVSAIGRKPAPMLANFSAFIEAGQVHVAVDGRGRVQGFVVFLPRGDHMLLESVAVRPELAGRGIGKALVRHCEDEARRLGLGAVRLYTNRKMTENLAIYPRLGYAETGRGIEKGFERVYFEKRLG